VRHPLLPGGHRHDSGLSRSFSHVRDYAHVALGAIRLFNGTAALLAPDFLARRLGAREEGNRADLYAFRLFGIRTVLIAIDLLLAKGPARTSALNTGVLIHASDTASAAFGGVRGEVPRGAAIMTTAISALNTFLALVARRPGGWRLW